MSERELLGLAAKAAGIEPYRLHDEIGDNGGIECPGWNPLTDDGDALWLAVKLDMLIAKVKTTAGDCRVAQIIPRPSNSEAAVSIAEPENGDPLAATRRAIVRAAAEIGKQANNNSTNSPSHISER